MSPGVASASSHNCKVGSRRKPLLDFIGGHRPPLQKFVPMIADRGAGITDPGCNLAIVKGEPQSESGSLA